MELRINQKTYQVDADGLLSVSAREATSGVESAIAVKPSYGLADSDITRMLKDSFEHARDDVHLRALREQQVEGERMLEAVNAALLVDGDLLSKDERDAINADLAQLKSTVAGSDHRAIKTALEHINHATEVFAAQRMDRSVKQALAGKNIANV